MQSSADSKIMTKHSSNERWYLSGILDVKSELNLKGFYFYDERFNYFSSNILLIIYFEGDNNSPEKFSHLNFLMTRIQRSSQIIDEKAGKSSMRNFIYSLQIIG